MKIALLRGCLFAASGLAVSVVFLADWDLLTGTILGRRNDKYLLRQFPIGFAISTVIGATLGFSLLPKDVNPTWRRIAVFGGLFELAPFALFVVMNSLGWTNLEGLPLPTLVCVAALPVSLVVARIVGERRTTPSDNKAMSTDGTTSSAAVRPRPPLLRSAVAGGLLGAAQGVLLLGLVVFAANWVSGARELNFGGGPSPAAAPFSFRSAENSLWITLFVEIFFGWAAALVGALVGAVAGFLWANFRDRAVKPTIAGTHGATTKAFQTRFRLQLTLRTLLTIVLLAGVTLGLIGRNISQSRREESAGAMGVAFERGRPGFLASIPAWGWLFEFVVPHSPTVVDIDGEQTSHAITDDQLTLLADAPRASYVSIQHTAITDESLKTLGKMRELATLKLADSRITGVGFRNLRELPALTTLNLNQLPLTDEGLAELANLTQLKYLSLTDVTISDIGLLELAKMKHLDWLGLENIRANEERVSELRVALGLRKVLMHDPFLHYVPENAGGGADQNTADSSDAPSSSVDTVPTASPAPESPAEIPALAIAPFDATEARRQQTIWAEHLRVPIEFTNSIGMTFRLIPPGEFLMGMTEFEASEAKKRRPSDDWWSRSCISSVPQHPVRLTHAFYIGVYEVTQRQYEAVMRQNPSRFSTQGEAREQVVGEDTGPFPVEMISFPEATTFCNRLSRREQLAPAYVIAYGAVTLSIGDGYRLPTEAEWEWACRAGTSTFWSHDTTEITLPTVAWFETNSNMRTHAVGQLDANSFGLHDMHGNVGEICQDGFDTLEYAQRATGVAVNPRGPVATQRRAVRGGHYASNAGSLGSPFRLDSGENARYANNGFRIAISVRLPEPNQNAAPGVRGE